MRPLVCFQTVRSEIIEEFDCHSSKEVELALDIRAPHKLSRAKFRPKGMSMNFAEDDLKMRPMLA